MVYSGFRRNWRAAGLAVTIVALGEPHGQAQTPISARLIRAEDARMLDVETQALFLEGMKSSDAKVRAQAVRAAGRYETPALVNDILPLLADADPDVRKWAAIAAANSARLFAGPAIEALLGAMAKAAPADWAELAASVARIPLATPAQFQQIEQALLAGLPAPATPGPAARQGPAPGAGLAPSKIEGAARGFEALTRVNGKVQAIGPEARVRLTRVVETPDAPTSRALVRARRLALAALRNARQVDGRLAATAAKDVDDEVRRLAVLSAAAATTADAPASIPDAEREAILSGGLTDSEPRVRLEALRGWGRHLQGRTCEPVVRAVSDPSPHVALQAIDLLGAGCPAGPTSISAVLQKEAEALPASGATWHRAAHAVVALSKASPSDVRTLLPRFVGHPTWQVRMYAARAAGQTGAIEALTRLGGDERDNVRQAALEELSRLKRPEALPVAYDALNRPDYQLVMTAARALAAEPDKPKAAKALLSTLLRLTLQGRDTSRDPRVAIVTTWADVGSTADVEAASVFLSDADPRVAELAAKAIERWTGQPRQATARRRPPEAPDLAMLSRVVGKRLRITMANGGEILLRLLPDEAPATVARVVSLAVKGHYDGLTFHRVEPTFVLQGGSPGANEFMGDGPYMRDEPGLPHHRGTIGISTRGRDTGDAQIFVNLVDSPRLDHAYTVFAIVERGLDVADRVLEGDVMTKVELVDAPSR